MRRGTNPSRVISAAMKGASARATMRAPEMKTQSPSGSRGRAGVRISNLPPWLSLLCMVIYIKEEPAMQIRVLKTLDISNPHSMVIVLPPRHSSCAWFSVPSRAECRQVTPCRVSSASGTKTGTTLKTFFKLRGVRTIPWTSLSDQSLA